LEAYKIQLISDIERLKYEIELSKSLELRVLEHKIEIYNKLVSAFFNAYQELYKFDGIQHKYPSQREEFLEIVLETFEALGNAWKANQLFISEEMNFDLGKLDEHLRSLYSRCVKDRQRLAEDDWLRIRNDVAVVKDRMNTELKSMVTKSPNVEAGNS